jgi:eukaryotic-like serine/threonine-protein kinase
MSSIVPGFEYDIFISYRHKDNKYDGWVTEFVANLKKEIEATFKEDISIYFDENPHDGLLETHDVDDSLKEKLKCLIFVPIISRTYCDPKSFAWNHEFLAFLKTAAADTFGLKVKLPNGNTASRVLPIRIHELDSRDRQMIEAELQGVLRAIDFTFQAAGVNRPLRPKDDDSIKIAGQNSYRDQINKTANAISDIIAGLQGNTPSPLERGPGGEANAHSSTPRISPPRRNWKIKIPNVDKKSVLIIALIFSLLTLAVFHFSETPSDSRTYRATLLPPEKTRFSTTLGGNIAISPDGNSLAFVATDSVRKSLLWLRHLNALEARALGGTEGAYNPFWSPDNRFIGFFADGKLKKIDVSGGMPQTLCDATVGRGGTWNKDGIIVFNGNANSPLSLVSASGGKAVALTKLDTARREASHRWPCFLPDGRHFLYTSRISSTGMSEEDAIFLASLDTTVAPRMVAKASSSIGYANGYLLFARQQTLMAQPFDAEKLQTSGDAFPIAEQINFDSFTSNASFSVSQNGHLVYQAGVSQSGIKLARLDRSGKQVGSINQEGKIYLQLRLSPDGERIVVSQPDANSINQDIWLYEIRRDTWTRFTFDAANDRSPIWSPDGKSIVFTSDRNKRYDLFQRASNGEGNEELLLKSGQSKLPSDWSHDGKYIAYHTINPNDIWILPMNPSPKGASGERKPFVFLQTEFGELRATFSPDGRWIAYQSDESGRDEIYIRPFPGPGGKWQVSTAGGTRPRWREDGKELFFVEPGRLMSAQVSLGVATVQVGAVQSLFDIDFVGSGSNARDLYDVSQDGQRFLVELPQGNEVSIPLTLVVNWPGEILKK